MGFWLLLFFFCSEHNILTYNLLVRIWLRQPLACSGCQVSRLPKVVKMSIQGIQLCTRLSLMIGNVCLIPKQNKFICMIILLLFTQIYVVFVFFYMKHTVGFIIIVSILWFCTRAAYFCICQWLDHYFHWYTHTCTTWTRVHLHKLVAAVDEKSSGCTSA